MENSNEELIRLRGENQVLREILKEALEVLETIEGETIEESDRLDALELAMLKAILRPTPPIVARPKGS